MRKEYFKPIEILESFQTETDDWFSLEIHDKTIRAEETDKEIDGGFFLWSRNIFAPFISFFEYWFRWADRNEASLL